MRNAPGAVAGSGGGGGSNNPNGKGGADGRVAFIEPAAAPGVWSLQTQFASVKAGEWPS
jgi:hypothetical protein